MTVSVVIAAHNESAVISRCLSALREGGADLDITVVTNGCTDDTAEVARQHAGVRVVELAEAGKAGALNAGDAVAASFPRVYLDADMTLTGAQIHVIVGALDMPGVLASTAVRRMVTRGSAVPVKGYYAINNRLPLFRNALFGRGVIALSKEGRDRFESFPGVIADDLFLDSLFAPGEKREVPAVVSRVAAPRHTRDLVRRLARVRAGNRALRNESAGTRSAENSSWLRDVALPRPWLAPAAVCYVAITAAAEMRARRATGWGRDESSRQAVAG
ncbi:glycosyltransferase [Phytohabitans flavus]|uniref:glycosyltransferase n=1 Tax=Phytohabitans flavus TaxID=1076124 RepID=UPI0031EEC421